VSEVPRSESAEAEVLSAIMVNPETMDSVSEAGLSPEDFYSQKHATLFRAMEGLSRDNKAIDTVTLVERLKAENTWESVGGYEALSKIVDRHGISSNIGHYCNIVLEKSRLRKVYDTCLDIARAATDPSASQEDILDLLNTRTAGIFDSQKDTSRSLHDIVKEQTEQLALRAMYPDVTTGIKLNIGDFDKMSGGLSRGDLVVFGGRPAMGKTASSIAAVYNAVHSGITELSQSGAVRKDLKAAIFSLEMTADSLIVRTLVRESSTPYQDWKMGRIKDSQWSHITKAADDICKLQDRLFIIDKYTSNVSDIRRHCKALKRRHGLDLVMIDYLQLVEVKGSGGTANERVSFITRELKKMAKDLEVVVILLSQLNRSLESRDDKRPKISDLRDSGAIEQDADLVAFVYRDVVYNPDADPHDAELIIAKNRSGPIGIVSFRFAPETQRVF